VVLRVPLWREKDVIWLDVMDPARAIGVNPLDAPADADPGVVVSDVMGVIKKVMGASWDTACPLYTSDAADEEASVDLGGRRTITKKNTKTNTLLRSDS